MAVAIHAVKKSGIKNKEKIFIIGAGTIGQLVMQVAKYYGAGYTMISDLIQSKLEIAQSNGADCIIKARNSLNIDNILNNIDIDIVFDCVSNDLSIRNAINTIKKKGKIIIVGQAYDNLSVDVIKIMWNELKIFGSCMYNDDDFLDAIELISKKRVQCINYISEIFDLCDIKNAFNKIIDNRDKYIKCLIKP